MVLGRISRWVLAVFDWVEDWKETQEQEKDGEVSQVNGSEISYGDYTEHLYDVDDGDDDVARLQEQFGVMTTQQTEACLGSVVDRIFQTESMEPFIDTVENFSDDLSAKETEIYDYLIGVKLEDGVITDTKVVGIAHQSPKTFKSKRIYTSPKITSFDVLIPVMVSDSVLYSNHVDGVRDLTPQSFASHLSDVTKKIGDGLQEQDGEYISYINKRINLIYSGLKNCNK